MKAGNVVAGKYRLEQRLGSGGMAEVWAATNVFTERRIAIKFMSPEVAKTPEAAARFLKEAKVSARVDHPNVIDVQDVGQTDHGQLFLVMELLTGMSLDVALRHRMPAMTMHEFAGVMLDVARALAAAHASGIVHRDLKPTNVFLHTSKDGAVVPKLLDFGVSKFLEDDQNHALTVAGTVLGSPLYMSPEQARGDANLDGRTDVYAFGAILFEALCGFRPYDAKNFNALIVKIATTRPKSIDEHGAHVPEPLRAVVRACLEPDLARRIPSFDGVVVLLRAARGALENDATRLPSSAVPPLVSLSATGPTSTPSLTPGTTAPSWHASTSSGAYTSPPTDAGSRGRHAAWLAVAAAVGAAAVALAFVITSARAQGPTSGKGGTATAPPPAAATAAAEAALRGPAAPNDEPPTMSVDALPAASAPSRGLVRMTARRSGP
jgi:serine/threonine-protein kinase